MTGRRQPREPTPEELAAIVVAVDALWPRPAPAPPRRKGEGVWRFSGRWWAPTVAARRVRPRPGRWG